MIIDTHLHLGALGLFNLSFETLKKQMKCSGVSSGIVSTVDCAEFDSTNGEQFPNAISQIEANEKLLVQLKKGCDDELRFYVNFWCKPATEDNYEEVYNYIKENADVVKGIKLHPFYSKLSLENEKYAPYLEIAQSLNLPVSVHTASDNLSNANQLLALAKKYREIKFIMVHLELMSDNEGAIKCISKADNLFGDTTWVPFEKIKKAINICGDEKIVFGSDAPIDGEKSYDYYSEILGEYKNLGANDSRLNKIMFENARKLYSI